MVAGATEGGKGGRTRGTSEGTSGNQPTLPTHIHPLYGIHTMHACRLTPPVVATGLCRII